MTCNCLRQAKSRRFGCWIGSLALFAFGLGGCAHFVPRPLRPAAAAQAWALRSLADPGLRQFFAQARTAQPIQWPLPVWTVDDLTLAAIYDRPDLAVAWSQWDAATAGTITAGERPNPSITVSGTYDTTTPPPWIPGLSFDLPIETGGKRGDRLAEARTQAEAARWDFVDKIWQVRASVRSALVDVYRAEQTVALLAQQERAEAKQVTLLEGQLRAGAIAVAELTPARIALDTTRLDQAQARADETAARAALAAAVGLPIHALRSVKLTFDGLDHLPSAFTESEARHHAVLNRADVRSALASYAASQAALQLEIAKQYPDIHLGPGYELDQTDNKWTLGLTIDLPVFNRNQGPIAEARARRRLAAAQFVAVQAKALSDAETAFAGYESALAQFKTAAELQQRLQQRVDSVRAMQQAGEVDPLAVAVAEVEYATGVLQRLNAVVKAQQALGALEAAVQSPNLIPAATIEQARAHFSHEP